MSSQDAAAKPEVSVSPTTEPTPTPTPVSDPVKTENVEVKVDDTAAKTETTDSETPAAVPTPKAKNEMNMMEIVLDFMKVDSEELPLTPKVKALMKKLPGVDKVHLENVEGFFTEIMKDKKIDMKDLPALMGLVQELYIMYDVLKTKANAFDVGAVFRTLIQLLFMYKLEKDESITEEEKTAILASLDMVLEMCTQMIELKDTQKKLKQWFSFLPCC